MKRLFRFTWRSQREIANDVAAEFNFHIDERTRALVESGMRPAEARAQALKEFGNIAAGARGCTSIDGRTETRRRAARAVADLGQDLRYGGRLVRRSPGFAVAAILTMAVAIGGNTAVFSLANALLLKPLPVASPETLVKMHAGESRLAWANAQDLHERAGVFSDLVLQQGTTVSLHHGALSTRVVGNRVSPNFSMRSVYRRNWGVRCRPPTGGPISLFSASAPGVSDSDRIPPSSGARSRSMDVRMRLSP